MYSYIDISHLVLKLKLPHLSSRYSPVPTSTTCIQDSQPSLLQPLTLCSRFGKCLGCSVRLKVENRVCSLHCWCEQMQACFSKFYTAQPKVERWLPLSAATKLLPRYSPRAPAPEWKGNEANIARQSVNQSKLERPTWNFTWKTSFQSDLSWGKLLHPQRSQSQSVWPQLVCSLMERQRLNSQKRYPYRSGVDSRNARFSEIISTYKNSWTTNADSGHGVFSFISSRLFVCFSVLGHFWHRKLWPTNATVSPWMSSPQMLQGFDAATCGAQNWFQERSSNWFRLTPKHSQRWR